MNYKSGKINGHLYFNFLGVIFIGLVLMGAAKQALAEDREPQPTKNQQLFSLTVNIEKVQGHMLTTDKGKMYMARNVSIKDKDGTAIEIGNLPVPSLARITYIQPVDIEPRCLEILIL